MRSSYLPFFVTGKSKWAFMFFGPFRSLLRATRPCVRFCYAISSSMYAVWLCHWLVCVCCLVIPLTCSCKRSCHTIKSFVDIQFCYAINSPMYGVLLCLRLVRVCNVVMPLTCPCMLSCYSIHSSLYAVLSCHWLVCVCAYAVLLCYWLIRVCGLVMPSTRPCIRSCYANNSSVYAVLLCHWLVRV